MTQFKQFTFALLTLFSIAFVSCSDDDSNETTTPEQGTSRISVKMMDDPGDYDHVYVEVVDVRVKVNDDTDNDDNWVSIGGINTGVYDLLELTGGVNVLLADDMAIPAGTLNQIRLILGDDNSIVIDGETHPLNTPSAQQSGLKVQVNHTLQPNIHYTFLLDFDVDDSIVIAGNSGNINLHPVIRATAEADSGAISGNIGANVQTEVVATNGLVTVSTYTDADGYFVLSGVPAGTYIVTATPDIDSGFLPIIVENVDVTIGSTTDLGVLNFD